MGTFWKSNPPRQASNDCVFCIPVFIVHTTATQTVPWPQLRYHNGRNNKPTKGSVSSVPRNASNLENRLVKKQASWRRTRLLWPGPAKETTVSRCSRKNKLVKKQTSWRRTRLLWPAPAKETLVSRCSCRSKIGLGALIGDSLTWGQRSDSCFAPTLLPRRTLRQFVSPSTPGDSGRFGTLRTGGMSSNARTPRNEGCGPVPAAVH